MKFYEFIGKLYERFPCGNKGRFVLQIFSALCGEKNPIETNMDGGDKYAYSEHLPQGLGGTDDSSRKALFESGNKGLTNPVREHILGYKNTDTFLTYCENVSVSEFPNLCSDFGLADGLDRKVVFNAIFEQFLEFARTSNGDAADVMQDAVDNAENTEDEQLHTNFSVINNGTIGTQKNVRIETVNGNITL